MPPATGSEANSVSFDPAAILVPEDRGPDSDRYGPVHDLVAAQVHVPRVPEKRQVSAALTRDTAVAADVLLAGNGAIADRDNGGRRPAEHSASRGGSNDGAGVVARR